MHYRSHPLFIYTYRGLECCVVRTLKRYNYLTYESHTYPCMCLICVCVCVRACMRACVCACMRVYIYMTHKQINVHIMFLFRVVNFTTQPPPGSNSILLYGKCNNADEDISAICSWPEDPFGFQPRLDISYPNGSSEAVSAGNADRLGIYCIQRTNFTTSSAGFQISTCEVINSATIGCLVNGLTSNNITFQKSMFL